ncbi:MAG: hypothetical protein N3B14_00050 [Thermoleophilia bacterium]|nr:hypothetical protein [Thermoleophilia bacterium]
MMQNKPYKGKMQDQSAYSKQPRPKAAVYRRRRLALLAGFVVLCLVIVGLVLSVNASKGPEQASAQTVSAPQAQSPAAPVVAGPQDHPAFARLGERNLLLPVAAKDATIIAYQPVSDERAVPLTPLGEQANVNPVVKFFRNLFAPQPAVQYYLLEGKGDLPTTSVLIGAPAGSPVFSPITGVVTRVTEYLLYGKYQDIQIEIRPEKSSGITVNLILISDPVVSVGQPVTAGQTVLGKVRECPDQLGKQIALYTHDSGSHVHLQVMKEPIR